MAEADGIWGLRVSEINAEFGRRAKPPIEAQTEVEPNQSEPTRHYDEIMAAVEPVDYTVSDREDLLGCVLGLAAELHTDQQANNDEYADILAAARDKGLSLDAGYHPVVLLTQDERTALRAAVYGRSVERQQELESAYVAGSRIREKLDRRLSR